MRRKVIAGNWKMNMLPNEAIEFIDKFAPLVKDTENEVILCVPYTDLFYALLTAQNTNIKIGAQNMHFEEKGAYTGEVSAQMLKSIGVEYVIIGHSERRQYFGETDEMINKKAKAILAGGLIPIICCGETLEQREAGITDSWIAGQIKAALEGLSSEDVAKSVIAYEPIWAIGTGKTCDSDEANRVIAMIRNVVKEVAGAQAADSIRILYGGSVKPSTIEEQMSKSDIDGALIGGASLKADSLNEIIEKTMRIASLV